MKLTELRQIIKEELKEATMNEMARIGSYFKLVDDWKEKIAAIPNMLSTTKQNLIGRIENVMKNKQAQGAEDPTVMSRADYGNQQEFQKLVTQYGILNFYSKPAPKEKPVSSGIKGRPKVIDASKKMIGANIINKYSKGSIDFSPEEIEFIETLYKAVKA